MHLYCSVKQKRKKSKMRWRGYCQKTGRGGKRVDGPASSLKEKKKKGLENTGHITWAHARRRPESLNCIETNRSMVFSSSNRAYII